MEHLRPQVGLAGDDRTSVLSLEYNGSSHPHCYWAYITLTSDLGYNLIQIGSH